jgi:hypothetical protein
VQSNFSSQEEDILFGGEDNVGHSKFNGKRESLVSSGETKKSLQTQAANEMLSDQSSIQKYMVWFIYSYLGLLIALSLLQFFLMYNEHLNDNIMQWHEILFA